MLITIEKAGIYWYAEVDGKCYSFSSLEKALQFVARDIISEQDELENEITIHIKDSYKK